MSETKKKAPAKKKAAPKKAAPKFRLAVVGDGGSGELSFNSELARDAAWEQLSRHTGLVSKGMKYSAIDDAGIEFRYLTIKSVSKL